MHFTSIDAKMMANDTPTPKRRTPQEKFVGNAVKKAERATAQKSPRSNICPRKR